MSANDTSRAVWQISAGPASRSYANLGRLKEPAADLFARMQRP